MDTGVIDVAPSTMSPKERKKIEKAERLMKKNREKWKIFVDFLLRHIAIVTTKYTAWENDEYESFKAALDKAQRLDEKEHTATASTYKKLKERAELLRNRRYVGESNRILKYIDLVARMRCLNLIARDFYKSIKKGKLEPLENILTHLQYWKGFTAASFDLRELNPKGVDANHPGSKYVMWLCLVRTLLQLGQKFLQSASEVTEIPLAVSSYYVCFNLTGNQLLVAERLNEILATHLSKAVGIQGVGTFDSQRSLNFSGMASSAQPKKSMLTMGGNKNLVLPGEDDHLTFELPPEPPKDKKKKGKGKKKGGKKSGKKKKKK